MILQRVFQKKKSLDQVSIWFSYDLTISIKTTEVVYQPASGKPNMESTIAVKGQSLQAVDKSTYLGNTLLRVVHIDDDVNPKLVQHLADYMRVFGTKVELVFTHSCKYRSVVLPKLLYACETWIVHQRHGKRLNQYRFHTSCHKTFLKIKWQDRILQTSWKGQGCRVHIILWNWHS